MKKIFSILMIVCMIFMFAIAASADLTDGLVAYYPFNGNANDESGNGNDGTVYGATLINDRFGNPDSAYSFDGVDDYIDIGNDPVFNIHNEITVVAWVNANTFQNASIMTKWKTESGWEGSWLLSVDNNGYPKFTVTGDGYTGGYRYTATSNTNIDLNSFHLLTGVYNVDDNLIRIFVDGIERGLQIGQAGSIFVSNSKILIGAHIYDITSGHREGHFNGIIDDVRIYNRALSEEEIWMLYNYNDGDGYLVTSDLWIKAVINTVERGPIEAVWQKGGEDTTTRGDQVIWGHFYASPSDVTWGSDSNPDLFVKIWFDVSGRIDVNYFHVSVPDIEVYSDYPYDETTDEHSTTTMSTRYIRHEYWR